MTCRRVKALLTSEELIERSMKKGYFIRILKHKYRQAVARLEGVQIKLQTVQSFLIQN